MRSAPVKKHRNRAFTVIEFAIVVVVASMVFGVVTPAITHHVDQVKSKEVQEVILDMTQDIEDFIVQNGRLPDSLDEVYGEIPLDQWGNPYQYLRIDGGSVKGKGKLRKDKNLVPINSDYDLYSMGPDGKTVAPLTAKASQDDIVRGRNGGFIGSAADY